MYIEQEAYCLAHRQLLIYRRDYNHENDDENEGAKEEFFFPFSPQSPLVHSCIFLVVGLSSCGMWDAASEEEFLCCIFSFKLSLPQFLFQVLLLPISFISIFLSGYIK